MTAPDWEFEYRLPRARRDATEDAANDFIVATARETHAEHLARSLRAGDEDVCVDVVLVRPPLFWYRVRTTSPRKLNEVPRLLSAADVSVRYVAPSMQQSLELGVRPDFTESAFGSDRPWNRAQRGMLADGNSPGHWFLNRDAGADVDRAVCGTGLGTKLAVIDDEARDAELLDLDAEVSVGVSEIPRGASHGAVMVAWAAGSRGNATTGVGPFGGVAPDAASRLYVIPKPGQGVLWLPLAIVHAVDDGADSIVCATYVEGTTSPLLDDALEFAMRVGRRGLGTAVVFPAGREISSAPGSLHASLTLDFADPASDPRVLCVAPSGRSGGWFFWTDKFGKRRPFANRGPSVRIAAPGDDMAYPFAKDDALGHAESSGASAILAGAALLVLGRNPSLLVGELYELLAATARDCPTDPEGPVADSADLLPTGRDPDGHDAKSGYGRASARRACIAASDPFAAALLRIGEDAAAQRFLHLRDSARSVSSAYSNRFGNWSARVLLNDVFLSQAASALCRHLRLLAAHVDRQEAQAPGAIARAVTLLIERLATHAVPADLVDETARLCLRARGATRLPEARRSLESALLSLASELWTSSAER